MSNQEDNILRQSRPQVGRRVHPARRTRRLVGGISVSSTLGLITAMFLGAQAEASEDVLEPPVTTVAPTTTSNAAPTTTTAAPTTVAPTTTTTLAPPPPPPPPRRSQSSNTKTKGS